MGAKLTMGQAVPQGEATVPKFSLARALLKPTRKSPRYNRLHSCLGLLSDALLPKSLAGMLAPQAGMSTKEGFSVFQNLTCFLLPPSGNYCTIRRRVRGNQTSSSKKSVCTGLLSQRRDTQSQVMRCPSPSASEKLEGLGTRQEATSQEEG